VRLIDAGGGRMAWSALPLGQAARLVSDAKTGDTLNTADRERAERLARHYAALPDARVISARTITAFSTDYPSINKLLPVWEVRLATRDGLTLFVDTEMDRLALVTNDARRVQLALFQNVHTLKFLEAVEPLRVGVMLALQAARLASLLFGAQILLGAKARGVGRLHRLLAFAALPLALAFSMSCTLHLLMTNEIGAASQAPKGAPFAVEALTVAPSATAPLRHLSATGGGEATLAWRAENFASQASYFNAQGAIVDLTDAARARALAKTADAPIAFVARFDGAYPFINKRVPVIAVGDGANTTFVDVNEGLIAARGAGLSPLHRVEALAFDHIHKREFLAGRIGRKPRDVGTMIAALMIAATAGFGLALAVLRARRAGGKTPP
jgi:hypothetical protein